MTLHDTFRTLGVSIHDLVSINERNINRINYAIAISEVGEQMLDIYYIANTNRTNADGKYCATWWNNFIHRKVTPNLPWDAKGCRDQRYCMGGHEDANHGRRYRNF